MDLDEERLRIGDSFQEEYHDIVLELPLEYQRNFTLLNELELAQAAATAAVQQALHQHLHPPSAAPSAASSGDDTDGPPPGPPAAPAPDQRVLLEHLAKNMRGAIRAGEDKLGLAVTMYESVDRHIRRLDADLAKHEAARQAEILEASLPPPPPLIPRPRPVPVVVIPPAPVVPRPPPAAPKPPSNPKKSRPKSVVTEGRVSKAAAAVAGVAPVFEGWIDPAEPIYCTCGRISFGEMIGCENDDCPNEWFHLECVGLAVAPTTPWHCDACKIKLGLGPAPPPTLIQPL